GRSVFRRGIREVALRRVMESTQKVCPSSAKRREKFWRRSGEKMRDRRVGRWEKIVEFRKGGEIGFSGRGPNATGSGLRCSGSRRVIGARYDCPRGVRAFELGF